MHYSRLTKSYYGLEKQKDIGETQTLESVKPKRAHNDIYSIGLIWVLWDCRVHLKAKCELDCRSFFIIVKRDGLPCIRSH